MNQIAIIRTVIVVNTQTICDFTQRSFIVDNIRSYIKVVHAEATFAQQIDKTLYVIKSF